MTDVLVDPTDRGRGLVVFADVTHELACEIFTEVKRAAVRILVYVG